jgi:hypothetical protein
MSNAINPAAPHHLPAFITAPGETDTFLVGCAILLVAIVVLAGSLYFRLHSLPERIAHGTSKLQFQLVAVLALIALFTHENLFWVAALLLALVPIPDFWTPLASMADSLAGMVGRRLRIGEVDAIPTLPPDAVAAAEAPVALADVSAREARAVADTRVAVPLAAAGSEVDGGKPPTSGTESATPAKRRSAKREQAASTERA